MFPAGARSSGFFTEFLLSGRVDNIGKIAIMLAYPWQLWNQKGRFPLTSDEKKL
jgi:hypothetical protein